MLQPTVYMTRGNYQKFGGNFGRLDDKTGHWSGAIGEVGQTEILTKKIL